MERKKIEELEVGKFYITSIEGVDTIMCANLLNNCTNKILYYLGGKQFRCSDDERCCRPISIDIPDMRYQEVEVRPPATYTYELP